MAVEGRHLNLFPSQLIPNRDMMKSNSGPTYNVPILLPCIDSQRSERVLDARLVSKTCWLTKGAKPPLHTRKHMCSSQVTQGKKVLKQVLNLVTSPKDRSFVSGLQGLVRRGTLLSPPCLHQKLLLFVAGDRGPSSMPPGISRQGALCCSN
ncbi:hypothetical protein ACFX13_019956 [Malus domestica]